MNVSGCRVCTLCIAGLLAAAAAVSVQAHPISVTRASVYLTREQATVRIEVFLEDLYLFHQLKPNGEDFLEAAVIEQGIRLHEQFLRERFEISDVEGLRCAPQSVTAVAVVLPEGGVPLAELMVHQLIFELRFAFPTPPDVLSFSQRFTDEKAVLPSEMKLQVTQENAGSPFEHTLLPHSPYSLHIDWHNPPLAPHASEQEQAEWAARKQESLLGITSYSSVYSFLYVEDFEVRHEILAPVMTLAENFSFAGHDDAILDVAEQEAARREVAEYFATGNPLIVDGQTLQPVVQRCDFYGLDMTDFARPSEPRPVPLANARVGVILSYPLATQPCSLRMTWNRFSSSLLGVTTVVIAGDRITRSKLSRLGKRNVLEWNRPEHEAGPLPLEPVAVAQPKLIGMSIPLLSCFLAVVGMSTGILAVVRRNSAAALLTAAMLIGTGAAWSAPRYRLPVSWPAEDQLSDAQALTVFRQVHANTYRSFERRNESAIYDALSLSVDGELLQRVYLEVRRGLAMEEQGGASARIHGIELVDTRRVSAPPEQPPSFRIQSRWNVAGTIEHWGHVHRRTNQYEAEFVVRQVDDLWKLVVMELFDEQHLDSQITLRTAE